MMAIGHYDPSILFPEPTYTEQEDRLAGETAGFQARQGEPVPDVEPLRVDLGNVIVVARSDDFFSGQGVKAMRAVVSSLEELDQVSSVVWMDRAPPLNIFSLSQPLLPQGEASPERLSDARERALANPLVVGQLLSPDARTMLLMVNLDWLFVQQDSDCTDRLRDAAVEAAAEFPEVDISFQVTGQVPISISRSTSTRKNEIKYQLIGYSIALLTALVLFRGVVSVIIVGLAPAFGVFWTLGLLHFLGFDNNPFNSVIVPVLLCMVGFTDGVHMMVQIRRHRANGVSAVEAARKSIREVGLACWMTSLTTAIGFGSLMTARHEVVREFGYCCVIGVLMTFVSVITIIPLACASRLGRNVHAGVGKNLVDQNLSRISVIIDYVLQRCRAFSWIAIAGTFVLAICTLQMRPDEKLTSSMAANSEPVIALKHVDEIFGGMMTAEVLVQWNANVDSTDGKIAEVLSEVDAILKSEPLVGNPLSICDFIDALPGDGDASTRMSLLDLLPPPLKRAYYTPERGRAVVRFRIQDIGIAAYGPVFERVQFKLLELQSQRQDFQIRLTGGAVERWENLYQIVVDLAISLGTASLIIFMVLAVVYRSLRLGLISIVPNVFPLAITGTLLWLFGQSLEIVSVCAFTVCLGIAVDDTIHFLTRYREEECKTEDRRLAIRRSFVGVGTALIMTTVVLIIGFSTALLSDSRDHRIFAIMGILTIGSALFADLVLLPALLLRFGGTRKNVVNGNGNDEA
ncbi:MAG: MMPL family transporter [Planctomycetaceae bacterium]|nr:MMPL family transporter [Planctomycetaceae bacterium]